jgi:hypothetical protein
LVEIDPGELDSAVPDSVSRIFNIQILADRPARTSRPLTQLTPTGGAAPAGEASKNDDSSAPENTLDAVADASGAPYRYEGFRRVNRSHFARQTTIPPGTYSVGWLFALAGDNDAFDPTTLSLPWREFPGKVLGVTSVLRKIEKGPGPARAQQHDAASPEATGFNWSAGIVLASNVDYDWLELRARRLDSDGIVQPWRSVSLAKAGARVDEALVSLVNAMRADLAQCKLTRAEWLGKDDLVSLEVWSLRFKLEAGDELEVDLGGTHPRLWDRYKVNGTPVDQRAKPNKEKEP